MKLTKEVLEELEYPGLFAQIGEIGYVEVTIRLHTFDDATNMRVRGIDENGFKFDKDYDSFDKFIEDNPYLRDLDFVKADDTGILTTRKLQAIIDDVNRLYGGFIGGVRVYPWERDIIESIKLNFTPETWVDLANKEGSLLPACCSSISEIRDQLISALREDGWINGEGIESIVVNMSSHDFNDGPIRVIANVFEIIKDSLRLRQPTTENPLEPSDACNMIYHFASAYSWASISSSFGDFESRACLANDIFNTIPALHTLYGKIGELDFGPIEGYALMDRVKGEVYKFASGGLAMFMELKDAEKLAKRWIESEQIQASRLDIRAIRISVQKGIEFLDSIENPFVDPNRMIPELDGEDREIADCICKEMDECEKKIKNNEVKIALRVAKTDIEKIKNRRNPAPRIEF